MLAGCGSEQGEAPPAAPIALRPEQLREASYRSDLAAAGTVKLTAGRYEEPESRLTVALAGEPALGDLDGDGAADAAVVLETDGGGSGVFMELAAVLSRGGAPVHAASALLGDRVIMESVSIEAGAVVVQMVTQGENDPMCCPTLRVVRRYRLAGQALVEEPTEEHPAAP